MCCTRCALEGQIVRRRHPLSLGVASLLAVLVLLPFSRAQLLKGQDLTLKSFRELPELTPEVFMAQFSGFTFKLGEELQDPELFLATRTGDCDDFASLAATLLSERKFTPRLIAVFMEGQTHVVCYIPEAESYLDYNCRELPAPLQPTNGNLEDIAGKVARYFRTTWRLVAEFTLESGIPRFGNIAFR